jgi:hypothetical protein
MPLLGAAILGIAGCATTTIAPTGGDTYYASKVNTAGVFGDVNVVAGKLMAKANRFCISKGKEFQLVSSETAPNVLMQHLGSASITFKCVMHAQDPAVRPDKAATIVN